MNTKTLRQLKNQRSWEQFEKNLFYWMTGIITCSAVYWVLVKLGIILIVY